MCFWPIEIMKYTKVGGRNVSNSRGKRYPAVRFRCAFCGKMKKNQTFSVVDGGRSCKKCDSFYS